MTTFTDLNLLQCASCRLEIDPRFVNPVAPVECGHCGKRIGVYAFPTLTRPQTESEAATPVLSSESACFYHPGKQATVICDECGRFLCALCDVEFDGRHLCAPCLEGDHATRGEDSKAGTRYVYYDTLALVYAVAGLLFFVGAIVLGPMALYTVVRRWNHPRSVLPRSKWRFVLAAILGLGQIALWIFVVFLMVESA
jgi:hypothetical protein